MKRKYFHNALPLLFIILICLIALIPLFKPGFPVTDDGDWMIIRLSAFYQSFREGQFPVRYLGRLNLNYGYPVANFLYPGFLYLGSILHVVGLSFVDSVKFILGLSLIGIGIVIFYWLKQKSGNLYAAISTLSVVLSPYVLFDIYKRGSVGEIFGIFLGVLIFISIYNKWRFAVPFVFGMMVISHNTVALLYFFLIILFLLFKKDIKSFIPIFLGLGISAFFWVPALYESKYVIFNSVDISNPFRYFAASDSLFLFNLAWIIALLIYLISGKKKFITKDIYFFIVFYIFSVFFASPFSAPFWTFDIFSKIVQFPFRFLSVALIAGSYILAKSFELISNKFKPIYISGIILIIVFQALPHLTKVQVVNKPDVLYSTNEATTTVSDEYLPKWVSSKPEVRSYDRMIFIEGDGDIYYQTSNSQTISATITALSPSILQINSIYYPGWAVALDGARQNIFYDNPYGLIRFSVPKGTFRLDAAFRETEFRFAVDLISLLFMFISIIYLLFELKNYKIRKLN